MWQLRNPEVVGSRGTRGLFARLRLQLTGVRAAMLLTLHGHCLTHRLTTVIQIRLGRLSGVVAEVHWPRAHVGLGWALAVPLDIDY